MKYKLLTNIFENFEKGDILCKFKKWYYKEGDARKDHYYLPAILVENERYKDWFEKISDEDLAAPYEMMKENQKTTVNIAPIKAFYDEYEIVTDIFKDFEKGERVFLCEDGKFRSTRFAFKKMLYLPPETVEDTRYCKPIIKDNVYQCGGKCEKDIRQPLINRLHNFLKGDSDVKGYKITHTPYINPFVKFKTIYHITIKT